MTDEAKALVALQRTAGLKTMPTPLTHDLRIAVSGKGPRAYDWQDKPHRLLYDACTEIETQAREIERLKAEVMRQMQWKTEAQNDADEMAAALDNIANESSDTWAREKARAALAGDSHDQ